MAWTTNICFSQFWGQWVWDQDTGRTAVWWGPTSGFTAIAFLLCPHMSEGMRDLSGVFFMRALLPFLGGGRTVGSNDLITYKGPTSQEHHMSFTMGLGFPRAFWRHTHIPVPWFLLSELYPGGRGSMQRGRVAGAVLTWLVTWGSTVQCHVMGLQGVKT